MGNPFRIETAVSETVVSEMVVSFRKFSEEGYKSNKK